MKTKSLLLAAATLAAAVLLTPSQAQAGGYRNGGYGYRNGGYNNYRDCGYVNYRDDCYRPVRVVRPVRVYRRDCAPPPVIRIGFGFNFGGGGGRCY